HGATFRWRHASLPADSTEVLGVDDQMLAALLAEEGILEATDRTVLLRIAQHSLVDVIDILWAAGSFVVNNEDVNNFTELAIDALDYAKHNPRPAWLSTAKNDDQLMRDLLMAVDAWAAPASDFEVLGSRTTRERLSEAASRLRGAFGRGAGL